MATLVKLLDKEDDIESRLCVTGQHREMLDQVLSLFDITPDFDLKIMQVNAIVDSDCCQGNARCRESHRDIQT